MKKVFYISLSLLFFFSCSEDNESTPLVSVVDSVISSEQEVLNPSQINTNIKAIYDQQGSFEWEDIDDISLWSAVIHGENMLSIGFGEEGDYYSETPSPKYDDLKHEIKQLILANENSSDKELNLKEDAILHYLEVEISNLETIKALRAMEGIRYLEPDGYRYFQYENTSQNNNRSASSAGCSYDGETIQSADYGTLDSGAKIPWNFYDHNINTAWNYSTGRGIGVGIIDTGTSANQSNLGTNFNSFYAPRFIQKHGTYVDSWWPWSTTTDGPNDKCGHGTSIAGAVGGPNNTNGLPVGVAYDCNLITYRGTSDVVLEGRHERKGVEKALKNLARNSDVNIISMSIGYPFSIGRIKDAIRYANNRGKLIFAAGGTSTSFTQFYGVIFPAWMPEAVAVTGLEEINGYNECDVCHTGSEIEFTIIMERANNKHQPVLGYYDNEASYFGGSSVATATTAGIAALVWAENPSWNKAQVLERLRSASEYYPTKNNTFGYGKIDALKAVRGY